MLSEYTIVYWTAVGPSGKQARFTPRDIQGRENDKRLDKSLNYDFESFNIKSYLFTFYDSKIHSFDG